MSLEIMNKTTTRGIIISILGILLLSYMHILRAEPGFMMQALMKHFQLSNTREFGNIAAKYYFAFAISIPLAGLAYDIFNPRILISLGIVLALIGNYLFGQAETINVLANSRALLGIANAIILIGVLKFGSLWLPKRHFVVYVGFLFAFSLIASGFSSFFISLFNTFDWRSIVRGMNFFGLILLPFVVLIYKGTNYIGKKVKVISIDEIIAVIKNPKIWITAIILSLGYLFFSLLSALWGLPFLKQTYNLNAVNAAIFISLTWVGFFFGAITSGILSDIIQKKRIFITLGYLASALLLAIMLFLSSLPTFAIVTLLFLMGFFLGATIICYALINDYVEPNYSAIAFSIITLVSVIINALLTAIPGAIYKASSSLSISLLIIPATLIVGALLAIYLNKLSIPTCISDSNIFKDLSNAWKGKEKLGRSFWIIYTLGNAFFVGLTYVVVTCFSNKEVSTFYQMPIISISFILPYFIFSAICVWRCGNNTSWWIGWKYITRLLIILGLLQFITFFYN